MMKHVALEYYGILPVSIAGTILSTHTAPRTAAHPIALLPSLQQVEEVSDLMCDFLSPLEVVNILKQQVHSVIPVKDHETDD
jgi:adenosine/AMP kinase